MFDINALNTVRPEKGSLLLSEPFLDDEYFKRAVILICEHDEDGTLGFVLNNYLDVQLSDLIEDFPTMQTRISLGGPVKTQHIYYIHKLGDQIPESVQITEDLYMGGDFNTLKELILEGKISSEDIRFFVGYAGWTPNQLEEELRINSWFVSALGDLNIMETETEELWKKILEQKGGKHRVMANFPLDPTLN